MPPRVIQPSVQPGLLTMSVGVFGMPGGLRTPGGAPVGTELCGVAAGDLGDAGPAGGEDGAGWEGASAEGAALGVTGTELPGAAVSVAEQAVRKTTTRDVAVAVRKRDMVWHLRE
ncbi:hypothetical protein GCM10010166_45610 [Couchioplanes caeruleus subsp. azureus]|nr:hypothetical protein GCM10010166_45610 [Couchioplanes caeruleus subsp. azureus]